MIDPAAFHQKQYAAECGLCAINHLLQKNTFHHQEILKEAPGIVDHVMDMPEGFMRNHDQHYNQEGWYSIEILVCLLAQAKMRVELSSPIGQKSEILLYPEVIGILVKHAHPSHYTAIVQIGNNVYHIDSMKDRNQGGIVELTEEGYQSIVANPTNHSYTVTKICEQPLISPLTPPRRQDNNNNDEDTTIITQINGEAQITPPRKSAKTHEKDSPKDHDAHKGDGFINQFCANALETAARKTAGMWGGTSGQEICREKKAKHHENEARAILKSWKKNTSHK